MVEDVIGVEALGVDCADTGGEGGRKDVHVDGEGDMVGLLAKVLQVLRCLLQMEWVELAVEKKADSEFFRTLEEFAGIGGLLDAEGEVVEGRLGALAFHGDLPEAGA